MTLTDDRTFYASVCISLALLLLAWSVAGLVRLGARVGLGVKFAAPLVVGAAVRILGIGLVSGIPALHLIRGPDEVTFLTQARQVVGGLPVLGSFPASVPGNLHVWTLIAELRVLGGSSDLYLRISFATLALVGIGLTGMAVAQLAGQRAGLVASWILALEPSGVFYSGVLEKEALMYLAEGLVLLGATRMMLKRDRAAMSLVAGGCAVALLTRGNAGVALGVAGGLVFLHVTIQRLPTRRARIRTGALVAVVSLAALGIALPKLRAQVTKLQANQNYYATDFSNLKLAPVDVSSPLALVRSLPEHAVAVLVQPYPWRLANNSQRFGAVATLLAWGMIAAAIGLVLRTPSATILRLAPFAYVFVLLWFVYALAVGNAGTGFRYRSHLLLVLGAWCAAMAAKPADQALVTARRSSGAPRGAP